MSGAAGRRVGLVAALLAGLLAAPAWAQEVAPANAQSAADAARQTRTLAVLFRADWCPQCHVLEPKIEVARTELEASPAHGGVAFVTLDFTDGASRLRASEAAVEHGIERVFAERAGRTGFMLVIDAETGVVESEISAVYEPDVIAHVLRASTDIGD